jgi:hypothetical protein
VTCIYIPTSEQRLQGSCTAIQNKSVTQTERVPRGFQEPVHPTSIFLMVRFQGKADKASDQISPDGYGYGYGYGGVVLDAL